MTIRIGLVGYGKIAQDEHQPAIMLTKGLELVAVASRHAKSQQVENFSTLTEMLAAKPEIDAIVLCQPPSVRFETAREALLAGKHVFMEKPPGISISEVQILCDLAKKQGVTLFTSWHSRWSPQVSELQKYCQGKDFSQISIEWKEDVRLWHPNQAWIWQVGGYGVLDPGINALSILTYVLSERVRLTRACFQYPENKDAPIAANMSLLTATDAPINVEFDWRQTGPQIWKIEFESANDKFVFSQGGNDAASTHSSEQSALAAEYRKMYLHFQQLVLNGNSDVDLSPLQIIADAYLCGKIIQVAPFYD